MNSPSRWKFALALAAIFVAGAVTGAFLPNAYRYYARGQRPPRAEDMAMHLKERFSRELALDAAQKEKISPLLEETARGLQTIRAESERRVVESMEAMHIRLRAILTPEQLTKLEAMEKRRRARMHRPPGPPPM